MNIAIDGRYIQDHFPGIARYTYNLVSHLADIVEEEIILYYNPALTNTRYCIEELRQPGKVALKSVDAPTFSLQEQYRLPQRMRADRIDVYHSPYYVEPYLPGCKAIVTIHDVIAKIYPQYLPSLASRVAFEITTRLALASARQIITVSQNSKNDLVRRYGVKPDKIAVVYEGADQRFRPRDQTELEPVRQRYGLPARFVLCVGINKPHKNVVRLIEAFDQFTATDVSLVIAGKQDPRFPQVASAIERARSVERIRLLDAFEEDDLPYIYNMAEVFAFPSLYEGFGLPVVEAMASGLPVVTSDRSSLPEVLGGAGVLIDPEDTRELTAALQRLLEDRMLREKLSALALQRASELSWHETAHQTLAIYQKVAGL